jgi:hypothetical protein
MVRLVVAQKHYFSLNTSEKGRRVVNRPSSTKRRVSGAMFSMKRFADSCRKLHTINHGSFHTAKCLHSNSLSSGPLVSVTIFNPSLLGLNQEPSTDDTCAARARNLFRGKAKHNSQIREEIDFKAHWHVQSQTLQILKLHIGLSLSPFSLLVVPFRPAQTSTRPKRRGKDFWTS